MKKCLIWILMLLTVLLCACDADSLQDTTEIQYSGEMVYTSKYVTLPQSDLDGNNHTNNCRYADMVEQAVPNASPSDFVINFSRETRLGDVIELFTSAAPEGKTIVSGMTGGETIFSALI